MGKHYVELCTYNPEMGSFGFGYFFKKVNERDWEKIQFSDSDRMQFCMERLLGYRFFDIADGKDVFGKRENVKQVMALFAQKIAN